MLSNSFTKIKGYLSILMLSLSANIYAQSSFVEDSLFSTKSLTFQSPILKGERDIQVYLPKNYQLGTRKYPVIYVLDSDFLFHQAVSISSTRSSRDLMPESIVIGISNSTNQQRFSLGMPMKKEVKGKVSFANGKPKVFLDFLAKELFPFAEKQFRTANHRTIVGMSPTAGVVMTSYLNRPELFDAYIAIASDPHFFGIDNELLADKFIKSVSQNKNAKKKWLYLSRGELDTPHNPNIIQIFNKLEKGFSQSKPNQFAKAEIIKEGEHYESSLLSFINAFKLIYPVDVWRPNYRAYRNVNNPEAEIAKFYKQLSKEYGFKVYPTVTGYWMGNSITGLARYFGRQKEHQKAINLLKWGLTSFPESIAIHNGLTNAFEQFEDKSNTLKFAVLTYELAKQQNDPHLDYFKQRVESLREY